MGLLADIFGSPRPQPKITIKNVLNETLLDVPVRDHTMALLPGSPAIDGGNPGGCKDAQGNLLTTDQRGMPRPDREDTFGCDIGAYETQSDQP